MDESQIPGYLELFDLPDSFSETQLKQAYHDLVQVWHPDKHSHNERLRRKADEKMKEINQAYQVLHSGLMNGVFHFQPITEPARLTRGHDRANRAAGDSPRPPHSRPAEPSAQDVPLTATASDEPRALRGNAFWILLIGLILLVVIVAPHGKKVAAPDVPQAAASPGNADVPLVLSIEGPEPGTTMTHFPISKAVDSKYGFKMLQFGMTFDEARRALKPERMRTNVYDELVTFWYGSGAGNRLGDLPLDDVTAMFFRGRLFKIEVSFSKNQEQMLKTLRDRFGPSFASDSLTRGSAALRAECWCGEKAFCAIVAPRNSDRQTGWDALVMYDQALYREAQDYARAEPIRAAQALSEDGFGEFRFGMSLKAFRGKLQRDPNVTEPAVGLKEAVVSSAEDSRLGRYPLSSARASFFQDKLFRIELDFELNRQELYEGFMHRFPKASDTGAWTRNGEPLRAKQYAGLKTDAAILAPRAGGSQWDSIVLCDRQMDERRREFERDAPRRAAKDL